MREKRVKDDPGDLDLSCWRMVSSPPEMGPGRGVVGEIGGQQCDMPIRPRGRGLRQLDTGA